MPNVLVEIWWLLKHGRRWRDVQRSESHPRLGQLRYIGRRSRPGGHVDGMWKLQPDGFDRAFGVDFPTEGNEPTPDGLAQLERLLADLDVLFERGRARIREAYEQMVEEPMPKVWREAFQLDHIQLPEPDEREPEWQVAYWCEAAQHWFVVDFRGDTVMHVEVDG